MRAEEDFRYSEITFKDKTPANEEVGKNEFIVVKYKGNNYWAMFKCPCGCENVISVSLQRIHKLHWWVVKSRSGRPSLYPSIWQNKGCMSHFWIRDGKVYWCKNTGQAPWIYGSQVI